MPLIRQHQDGCVRLTLARGRGNALDAETLAALEAAFVDAEATGAPPILLGARGRSFCTGLDLVAAADLDREGMTRLMEGFHRTISACFAYPGPVLAVVAGHALAGGAILALACDGRIVAREAGRLGIHGVHLGVAYPRVAVEVLRHQLGRAQLEEILYRGHLYEPEEAVGAGLVDAVVDGDRLESAAHDWIASRSGRRGAAFAQLKRCLRAPARTRLEAPDEAGAERWLDLWFSLETRSRVEAARAALGEGRGGRPGDRAPSADD